MVVTQGNVYVESFIFTEIQFKYRKIHFFRVYGSVVL